MSSNNNGGPWGAGNDDGSKDPRKNAKRGSESDLENFLRRQQDKMKNTLGTENGGWNPKTVGLLVLAGLFALIVYNSAFTVAPDQTGVVTRFGAYQAPPRPPGLNFMFWPVDRVQVLRVTAENLEEIGYRSGSDHINRQDVPDESLMLTADENIVSVGFNVTWAIKPDKPQDFLFNVAEVQETIRAVAESAMREVVGRNRAEDIITKGQSILQADVVAIMQRTLDSYGAGVQITNVTISRPEVPPAVREAFNDVQQAAQDAQTYQNQSRRDANQTLADARADAVQMLQEAEAYAQRAVVEAQGEASRFLALYNEYRMAKDVTQQRLFLETMERVLGNANKIILPSGNNAQGVLPYLPLPQLQKNAGEEE